MQTLEQKVDQGNLINNGVSPTAVSKSKNTTPASASKLTRLFNVWRMENAYSHGHAQSKVKLF